MWFPKWFIVVLYPVVKVHKLLRWLLTGKDDEEVDSGKVAPDDDGFDDEEAA